MPWKRLIVVTWIASTVGACSEDHRGAGRDGGADASTNSGADTGSGPAMQHDTSVPDTAVPDSAAPADAAKDASMAHCKHVPSWIAPEFTGVKVSSLNELCKHFRCITRIEDAIANASWPGGGCYGHRVERGCGFTTVRTTWSVYHFETDTNRLVGAEHGSDIFFGFEIEGCAAAFFQGGEAPGPCATRTVDDLCDDGGAEDAGNP